MTISTEDKIKCKEVFNKDYADMLYDLVIATENSRINSGRGWNAFYIVEHANDLLQLMLEKF